MNAEARVYVAGAGTIAGNAIVRRLLAEGFSHLVGSDEPNFRDRAAVDSFFEATRPQYVFLTAGTTAGIAGNQRYPADLMIDNLLVAGHLIPAAWRSGAEKLLYLTSSCTYPKLAPQPLQVSSLWEGALEPTSAAYAVAKLAGLTLCDAFRQQYGVMFVTAIGADAYGPGDDFRAEHSHVVAALIRRMHEAKIDDTPWVEIWGSGTPRREFVYADDLADACVFAMRRYEGRAPLNLGVGATTSISELAETIRDVVGYRGELKFDRTKPDGMPFKGLDSTPLQHMGWKPQWDLRRGLARTYEWFLTEPHR